MTRTSVPAFLRGVTLIAVTLFCVPAATAAPIVLDAAGAQTLNNLQALALAAQNYESTFGRFPSDYVDGGGTAILSWRVSLLPFLNQGALFNQFDTTKPWNDAVNLPLLSLMPDVFRSPASAAGSTDTDYAGAAGSGTMFPGGPGPKLGDIADGASNTILFGEVIGSSIPWTQPLDITLGSCPTLGGSGFSSFISGAVPVAFVDGSVGLLPDTTGCNAVLALLGRNDSIVIDRAALLLPYQVAPVPEPPLLLLLVVGTAALCASPRLRHGRRSRLASKACSLTSS